MERKDNSNQSEGKTNSGFEKLLAALPEKAGNFSGSEYPWPAAIAYLGHEIDGAALRKQAEALRFAEPQQMCETALMIAELIESAAPDHDKYFQTDAKTRGHVFGGSKWRSGWILILGSGDHAELARSFIDRGFLVFAQNGAGLNNVIDLGPRETAAVYFLQVMVRYAMIWGGIKPGDDHEMGHFLENDLPGVVVADGKLTPVEELLLLGLMKMGAPAVVPPDYPWDLGRQVRAADRATIVEAAVKFPNLRIKEVQGKIIELPSFSDPANMRAEFAAEGEIGGGDSFFVLMPGDTEEGIEVPAGMDLAIPGPLGIIVRIGDKRLDIATSEYIEKEALRGIGSIAGLRARQSTDGGFIIQFSQGIKPDANRIAELLQKWVHYQFPYIENVHVEMLAGDAVTKNKPSILEFKAERSKAIRAESDETVSYFNYCIECQPFSRDHVCIITPDRPPMCSRDRFQVKSATIFGASWHPWKRRGLENEELRGSIKISQPIDARKGEYAEVNQAVKKLSPRHIDRVQLHAVREFPHTSCGCFQFLTFWSDTLGGIGVMERDYKGEAPGGLTWDKLANSAGGKQTPGLCGVSRNYLRSKKFMQGEGGLDSIKWLSPRAYEALKERLPHPDIVQVGQ